MKTIFVTQERNGSLRWIAVVVVLTGVLTAADGCSVYMAANQPAKKNLQVLSVGTPRSLLLAEIGQPQASEMKDGKRVDVFSFVQGYSKGAKTGRALFHGAADVLTAGLWELVATPTEATFTGERMAYEVTYDSSDRLEKVVTLIGEKSETSHQALQEAEREQRKKTDFGSSENP